MSPVYRVETGKTLSQREVGSTLTVSSETKTTIWGTITEVRPVGPDSHQIGAYVAVKGAELYFRDTMIAYIQDPEPVPSPAPDPEAVNEFRTRTLDSALKLLRARLFLDIKPNYNAAIADAEYAQKEFDTYVRGFADVLGRTS
jgi:hypothetical protein